MIGWTAEHIELTDADGRTNRLGYRWNRVRWANPNGTWQKRSRGPPRRARPGQPPCARDLRSGSSCEGGTGVCHAHRPVHEGGGTHGREDDDGWQVIPESRCADRLPGSDTGPCTRFPPDRRTRSGGLSGTGRSTRTSTYSRLAPRVPYGARSGTGTLSLTASPSWCSWSAWRPCQRREGPARPATTWRSPGPGSGSSACSQPATSPVFVVFSSARIAATSRPRNGPGRGELREPGQAHSSHSHAGLHLHKTHACATGVACVV